MLNSSLILSDIAETILIMAEGTLEITVAAYDFPSKGYKLVTTVTLRSCRWPEIKASALDFKVLNFLVADWKIGKDIHVYNSVRSAIAPQEVISIISGSCKCQILFVARIKVLTNSALSANFHKVLREQMLVFSKVPKDQGKYSKNEGYFEHHNFL